VLLPLPPAGQIQGERERKKIDYSIFSLDFRKIKTGRPQKVMTDPRLLVQ